MGKEEIYVFDDGSLESKVLNYELERCNYSITKIDVQEYSKLDKWVARLIENSNDTCKVFLHFPIEDYIQKDIRTEIQEAEHRYKFLRVIPWYEQTTRHDIEIRAKDYGIEKSKTEKKADDIMSLYNSEDSYKPPKKRKK